MIDFLRDHKWIISLLLMFAAAPIFIGLASIKGMPDGFIIYFVLMAVCSTIGGIISLALFLAYEVF